jgi:hypothetical protein
MTFEAGKGNARVYRIAPDSPTDSAQIKARKHYVGIDAAAWFVNKSDSWFSKKTVSGTIQIKMSGGNETYNVGMGTFELRGGIKIAPIFGKPILPDRNYLGGSFTITCTLSAIKQDTVISSMLKSAGDASLGVVAGMVDTASLAGPSKLLSAAGSSLVGSVRDILTETGPDREELFTSSGVAYTLRPEELTGSHIYLLLHRGEALDESSLKVGQSGELEMPFYNNAELQDGAWVLLRIRRSDEYSGVREWYDDVKGLRNRISNLLDDTAAGFRTRQDALSEFTPTAAGDKTIADAFATVRSRIQNDGVLCERQASVFVGNLRQRIVAAIKAIKIGQYNTAEEEVAAATRTISDGRSPGGEMESVFVEEVTALSNVRRSTLVKDIDPASLGDLSPANVFDEMRFVAGTFAEV